MFVSHPSTVYDVLDRERQLLLAKVAADRRGLDARPVAGAGPSPNARLQRRLGIILVSVGTRLQAMGDRGPAGANPTGTALEHAR